MMIKLDINKDRYAAIFGQRDDDLWGESGGRQRHCKQCGGWHRTDEPVPHNCRTIKRRMQYLSAPQIMPDVPVHRSGDVIINSRSDQREFMKRTGFVEHEDFEATAGTGKQDFTSREYEEDLVNDIKRAIEEPPENRPPPMMIEEANEHVNAEEQVAVDDIEVIE